MNREADAVTPGRNSQLQVSYPQGQLRRSADRYAPGMDEELQQMALEVLGDVLRWSLKTSSWERVGQGLAGMERPLEAADVAGFRRAVADVEMAGPHRISGVEEAASLPFPEAYRERVNQLIHRLGAEPEEGPSPANRDANGSSPHGSGPHD